MTRDEAMQLARTVSRECYRRWRVSENWEAVDMDSLVAEFLAEPLPAPDVQGADKLGGNSAVQAQDTRQDTRPPCNCPRDYAQYLGDDPHNRWCPRSRNPHPEVIQAQIDAARERGIRESAGIVERCGLDGLRDKILAQIGMGKVQP